ncbi:tropinone reductase homolog At5g06060-like [Nicotiana tabacum]|uniref:Tropinone reductase homolog At5g06060-like n=1 Tax=Nicotiana tabacum TaxID=4097 RepID=A0AC58RUE1_TOBAC
MAGNREERMTVVADLTTNLLNTINEINNVGTNIWKPSIEYTAEDYSHMMVLGNEFKLYVVMNLMMAAGMIQLTRNLACEWGEDGIRVNAVAPWYTKTPLVKNVLKDKPFLDELIARMPLRRPGEVEEASSVVAYLCLSGASYVTGQVIAVDGGFTVYGFK